MADPSDDPESDPAFQARLAALLGDAHRLRGSPCVRCSRILCGHEALFSIALGAKDAARCLPCLAAGMGRDVDAFRDDLVVHVRHRDCFGRAWDDACRDEGLSPTPRPSCLENRASAEIVAESDATTPPAPTTMTEWDAGAMSCGDLVLALRIRLRDLPPGTLLRVTARDPAAPHDLPAWCRLTGNAMVSYDHPHYLIRRKGG